MFNPPLHSQLAHTRLGGLTPVRPAQRAPDPLSPALAAASLSAVAEATGRAGSFGTTSRWWSSSTTAIAPRSPRNPKTEDDHERA